MAAQRFHGRIAFDFAACDYSLGKNRRFSATLSRTKMPIRMSRKLARNGKRQPHVIRSSRGNRVTRAKRAGREQIPDRYAERRETAPEAAQMRRRIFDQENYRPAIFGAGAQPLYDT